MQKTKISEEKLKKITYFFGALFLLITITGLLEQSFFNPLLLGKSRFLNLQIMAFIQLGSLGMFAVLIAFAAEKIGLPIDSYKALYKALTFFIIFSIVGELGLRIIYINGTSFGHRRGPIQRHFERGVVLNRYDGSRGPAIPSGIAKNSKIHILIQGDSLTWGQGIRTEKDLYSSVLLNLFNEKSPHSYEMAVLAKNGRELNQHSEQLDKWGNEINPDIIIYQWHITDFETNKKLRPKKMKSPWSYFFLHGSLMSRSFFWFLLDNQLQQILPPADKSYKEYIEETYITDDKQWLDFENRFLNWLQKAHKYTDRIVFLTVIEPTSEFETNKLINFIKANGIKVVDTSKYAKNHQVSSFDRHFNAEAHYLMSKALFAEITEWWPELLIK